MVSYDTIHRAISIHKVSTCLGKLLFNVSETSLKVYDICYFVLISYLIINAL